MTSFINTYAFIFLVGGAIRSAVKYAKVEGAKARVYGNIPITIGGLLLGIGGGFAKAVILKGSTLPSTKGILGYGS